MTVTYRVYVWKDSNGEWHTGRIGPMTIRIVGTAPLVIHSFSIK